jgi:hypothetical protein
VGQTKETLARVAQKNLALRTYIGTTIASDGKGANMRCRSRKNSTDTLYQSEMARARHVYLVTCIK